jgi:hypothetical protein
VRTPGHITIAWQLSTLAPLLAGHTAFGPRDGLEPLDTDSTPAAQALAKTAIANSLQGCFYHLQHATKFFRLPKKLFLGRSIHRTICHVESRVVDDRAALFGHLLGGHPEFSAPALQFHSEFRQLSLSQRGIRSS